MNMPCFEVTLRGFQGGTDETDDLVKWVLAPNRESLEFFIDREELRSHVAEVQQLSEFHEQEVDSKPEALDATLDGMGFVIGESDHEEWPAQSQALGRWLAEQFENEQCPKCGTRISDFADELDDCLECGHALIPTTVGA
jgi:hypothetical protein